MYTHRRTFDVITLVFVFTLGRTLLGTEKIHAQSVMATVHVGSVPDTEAVNPAANKIYVAHGSDNSVTVIDGTTNDTSLVPAGSYPFALGGECSDEQDLRGKQPE